MTELVKKLLIGASVIVGASTMGAIPTYAASLTGIEFHDPSNPDIGVYYEDEVFVFEDEDANDLQTRVSSDDLETEAINALTDGNSYTNVELGFSSETQNQNVGFSGMLGDTSVKVETVTAADWLIFGDQWIDRFSEAYSELGDLAQEFGGLIKTVAPMMGFGDPNISGFMLDESTGEYKLDMVGHYNVMNAPRLQQYRSQFSFLEDHFSEAERLLDGRKLQMSEIAKVTIGDEVHYAYSFSATETGHVAYDAGANDTSSHTGLYSWTFQGEPIKSVPEPSTMLGLVAVGGLATLSRRKSRNKA